ncbi:membrane protein EE43 [Elephantid betaherpesvirus 1]|uniref:Membrane protein EE43 n=1 Tax=Elephantid herpesvirus 1 TaxID=146015 RepID=M4JU49_ELHV1|nr:membrane protein EE43 [Elephantid betaherpesvirus 1]
MYDLPEACVPMDIQSTYSYHPFEFFLMHDQLYGGYVVPMLLTCMGLLFLLSCTIYISCRAPVSSILDPLLSVTFTCLIILRVKSEQLRNGGDIKYRLADIFLEDVCVECALLSMLCMVLYSAYQVVKYFKPEFHCNTWYRFYKSLGRRVAVLIAGFMYSIDARALCSRVADQTGLNALIFYVVVYFGILVYVSECIDEFCATLINKSLVNLAFFGVLLTIHVRCFMLNTKDILNSNIFSFSVLVFLFSHQLMRQ